MWQTGECVPVSTANGPEASEEPESYHLVGRLTSPTAKPSVHRAEADDVLLALTAHRPIAAEWDAAPAPSGPTVGDQPPAISPDSDDQARPVQAFADGGYGSGDRGGDTEVDKPGPRNSDSPRPVDNAGSRGMQPGRMRAGDRGGGAGDDDSLHGAVRRGDVGELLRAIRRGVDVDSCDGAGTTGALGTRSAQRLSRV